MRQTLRAVLRWIMRWRRDSLPNFHMGMGMGWCGGGVVMMLWRKEGSPQNGSCIVVCYIVKHCLPVDGCGWVWWFGWLVGYIGGGLGLWLMENTASFFIGGQNLVGAYKVWRQQAAGSSTRVFRGDGRVLCAYLSIQRELLYLQVLNVCDLWVDNYSVLTCEADEKGWMCV